MAFRGPKSTRWGESMSDRSYEVGLRLQMTTAIIIICWSAVW